MRRPSGTRLTPAHTPKLGRHDGRRRRRTPGRAWQAVTALLDGARVVRSSNQRVRVGPARGRDLAEGVGQRPPSARERRPGPGRWWLTRRSPPSCRLQPVQLLQPRRLRSRLATRLWLAARGSTRVVAPLVVASRAGRTFDPWPADPPCRCSTVDDGSDGPVDDSSHHGGPVRGDGGDAVEQPCSRSSLVVATAVPRSTSDPPEVHVLRRVPGPATYLGDAR